jgi:AcrR family transcriptional regulator
LSSDPSGASRDAPSGFSEQKHRQILNAAARLFVSRGYEATTVDAIAQLAGVSKATIYAHAGSKQELFIHILHSKSGELWRSLEAQASEFADIVSTLREIGRLFLELILSQDGLDLYRVIVSEAPRSGVGRIFYETGPCALVARVAAVLETARERGELEFDSATRAAEVFLGILQSHDHMPRLLGTAPMPSTGELDATVGQAVAIFLKAFRSG